MKINSRVGSDPPAQRRIQLLADDAEVGVVDANYYDTIAQVSLKQLIDQSFCECKDFVIAMVVTK